MLMKSIITLVLLFFLHQPTVSLDRIVGGTKAKIEEFPYQLSLWSLRYNGHLACGGVVISKDVGLTAAHCIQKQGSYSVRAGSSKDSNGDITYVKQAILHPYYTSETKDYDIAILKFSHPLRFNGHLICSGVIISNDIGLSAAHCARRKGSYSVRAGTTSDYEGGISTFVKQIIVHPYNNKETQDFDIAILKFSHPLRYSDKIKPVNLPKQDEGLPLGVMGYVSGFGSTTSKYPYPSHELRAVKVPVVSNELCVNVFKDVVKITPRMFCAGFEVGGKDACLGDSGGPFVANGTLYGLVSWGIDCGKPRYPGVYTNISSLRNYIRANSGV